MIERLVQSVETSYHPSNPGSDHGIPNLIHLVYRLSDTFVQRWNLEEKGKRKEIPRARRLTTELKRRFVLCLRKVVFMGISNSQSTVQGNQSKLRTFF